LETHMGARKRGCRAHNFGGLGGWTRQCAEAGRLKHPIQVKRGCRPPTWRCSAIGDIRGRGYHEGGPGLLGALLYRKAPVKNTARRELRAGSGLPDGSYHGTFLAPNQVWKHRSGVCTFKGFGMGLALTKILPIFQVLLGPLWGSYPADRTFIVFSSAPSGISFSVFSLSTRENPT